MRDLRRAYLELLKKRKKESRIYRKHQLIGLEIASLLDDERHKTLYIKMAKEHNAEKLLSLAKEIAERKNVLRKGAYFMACLNVRRTKRNASNKKNSKKKSPASHVS